ncbi:unnamed protein product [Spirodela intermedia]|uniref:Uncharacterized protein n=1 Tax=Spirodela intermedia TaxID=51605 RepID=A0A7I8JJ35_SPIIN|nr:unnamed protein product [Spirodela intermedia]CAA6670174.1 unnamed protein product [Spirodela intermedia]
MVAKENGAEREDLSYDSEKEVTQHRDMESDYEPSRNSVSSQDVQTVEENKARRASRVPQKLAKKHNTENTKRGKVRDRQESNRLQFKASNNGQNKSQRPNKGPSETKNVPESKSAATKFPDTPSESSEGSFEKTIEERLILDEAPNGDQSVGTDDETPVTEENSLDEEKGNQHQNVDEMKLKIEKLEQELREVAALEISLYSVVPEHGSSAHKLHTPARRLSRLYIHACKHWTQDRKATVARNTVSGLVLIAKSCGNDVPRLTFWLSNTVVLREIISQAFGVSSHTSLATRVAESNGFPKKAENIFSSRKWNSNGIVGKQARNLGLMQFMDDWQETGTFTSALEKIESWIFSRIVESVWWQTLAPHMQSSVEDLYGQDDDNFSTNIWKKAFREAFKRLCPVREGKHECGCLPVLARMVMEQCVARLDVAMFNAILRESANEIPTDPVSDPIVEHKVLPIPAGDLSFGTGAQLKNSIGNWSRCLAELFGMDSDDSAKSGDDQIGEDGDHRQGDDGVSRNFPLLNSLSDLLMLPKDMLLSKSIRKEVCPMIGLPLITRILCNFAPDEFCPDPILLERRSAEKALINSIPCTAEPIAYCPPSPAQRRGYTSDEDLEDLDSPLTSIIDRKQPPAAAATAGNGNGTLREAARSNMRFKLLLEVWSE